MAIELTEEMRERIGRALDDGFPVVGATVDAEGQPTLSFYGSTHVFSKDQLAIWVRDPASGVLSRLRDNPRMAFLYRDPKEKIAWQFFGRGYVVTDPDLRQEVWKGVHPIEQSLDMEDRGVAVVIDIDRLAGMTKRSKDELQSSVTMNSQQQ